MTKMPGGTLIGLTPRQQDIYEELSEEGIPTPTGGKVTPQWVKDNYPSTPMQPRKNKKSKPKTKRRKKKVK